MRFVSLTAADPARTPWSVRPGSAAELARSQRARRGGRAVAWGDSLGQTGPKVVIRGNGDDERKKKRGRRLLERTGVVGRPRNFSASLAERHLVRLAGWLLTASLFASSAATGRSRSTTSWKCSASVDRWPTGASRPASIAASSSGSTWCAPSRPCSERLGPGSGTPGSGWSRRSSRRARSITGSPAPRRHSSWRRRPASIRWSPTASCGSSSGSRASRSPARRWASTLTDRRPFTAPTWRSSARSSRSRWRSSSRPKAPQRLLRLIRAWRRASWVEEVRYYCAPGPARRAVERAVRSARAEERVRILQAVSR